VSVTATANNGPRRDAQMAPGAFKHPEARTFSDQPTGFREGSICQSIGSRRQGRSSLPAAKLSLLARERCMSDETFGSGTLPAPFFSSAREYRQGGFTL
jgi:hypothetical protein